ncbi:MAG TPA: VanZ family protein [Prolixibacteraceae bacterium]|nr:VanZ family protein [Prolixibacteraceae bacterium]
MIYFLLAVRQPVRIFLVILYVGCIAALSLLPSQDLPNVKLFYGADKVIHFSMYFVFSLLFCWALKTELNYSLLFLIIPVTIGWGILMEVIQLDMHAGRSFSLYDILANSIGVVAGILVYVVVSKKIFS